MANVKISALGAAGSLAGTEVLPLVQGGVTKKVTAQAIADLFSGGGVLINELGAATGANSINSGNNAQAWAWNTLGNVIGLSLTSTSTAAAGNGQTLFKSTLTGANATATQTTYSAILANQHTGTTSTNVALLASATGGTNNYAGLFTGNIGLNNLTPTAELHIGAGTAAAGTAPIKLTSGTNLTTPEAGALEWNGTNLFVTQTSGPTRKTLAYALTNGSATTANGSAVDLGGTATGDINITLGTNSLQIDTNGTKPTGVLINNSNNGTTVIGDITNNLGGIGVTVDSINDLVTVDNAAHTVQTGINTTSPTAYLHLAAGTATAGTAPIKLTTGTNLTVAVVGALEYTTPQLFFTNGGAQRQEIPQIQQSRVSTQFDKTNSTLANITGLTATVVAGKVYRFEASLYCTADSANGIKFAIGGTATATAVVYGASVENANRGTVTLATTLGTVVGDQTAIQGTNAFVIIKGTITVNAAGTLTCQFAQNSTGGVASSVLVGSTFCLTQML